MFRQNDRAETGVSITFVKPYNFALSMYAERSFQPRPSFEGSGLRLPARIAGSPVVIEVTADEGETR